MKKIGISLIGAVGLLASLLIGCRPTASVSSSNPDSSLLSGETLSGRNYTMLQNAAQYAYEPTGEPRIVPLTLESEDTPIAVYNAVQFGAKGDGKTNDTVAIHKALMAAYQDGGGTVFLPAGTYYCKFALTIPRGVTLRGEWAVPGAESPQGTLLLCDYGAGEKDLAFITMKEPSGLKNLSIYYPNQRFDTPVVYTPTLKCIGNSAAVENVTLYNPYIGMEIGSEANELHHIRNVYMTPLYRGITINQTTDIGRIQSLHISAAPYAECGFSGAPLTSAERKTLADTLRGQAAGIVVERSDWQYMADVEISDMNAGIVLKKGKLGSNGQLYGFTLRNCQTAFDVNEIFEYGWAVSNGRIENCKTGFSFTSRFKQCMEINDVVIDSTLSPVVCKGYGQVSIANAVFSGWDQEGWAVWVEKGTMTIQNSDFRDASGHIRAPSATALGLAGCTFGGDPEIKAPQTVEIVEKQGDIPADQVERPVYPYTVYSRMVSVRDFGAAGDGKTESAAAFQQALDQMAAEGGGVVYVPAGEYRLSSTITIPSGVELRGSMDVEYHSVSTGSMLSCTIDPAGGGSLIEMEADSSLRGLTLCCPEQHFPAWTAMPFAIKGLGENIRIKDITSINCYNGIDLQSHRCDNFFISYAAGCFIKTGIRVGGGSSGGVIENCQFNPHYWMRTPAKIDRPVESTDNFKKFVESLTCFEIGDAADLLLFDNFTFTGNIGVRFFKENGRGASGLVIGHGADSTTTGIDVEGADKLTFLNTELVNLNSGEPTAFIRVSGGDIRFVNTLLWGDNDRGIVVEGGKTAFHQTTIFHFGNAAQAAADISGGEAAFSSLRYEKADIAFQMNGGKTDAWFTLPRSGSANVQGTAGTARMNLKTP